jgi:hypothetical protein
MVYETTELNGWIGVLWGFALSGPGQLLFAGVAAVLALKAALRFLALILTVMLAALLFGGVTFEDLAFIAIDFARRALLAAAAFRQG